eukprot:TRINITY_DN8099_c0_g5_i1.p1 TRINITY_DN8099_c0_g5~~TRINITY_DN8099_c0_g5_i1.p1  ORF type:complete len:548 (+),score=171.12 TRINITY_DN8099_c0_g5_i1:100-1743(+)
MSKDNNESMKVFIRVRPQLKSESLKGIAIHSNANVIFSAITSLNGSQWPTAKGASKVNTTTSFSATPLKATSSPPSKVKQAQSVGYMQAVFNGISSTIFAYGQTGSGKTHTMFGPNYRRIVEGGFALDESDGIIPRAVCSFFKDPRLAEYRVYCSFMQLYNEKLYDLLEDDERKHTLQIRENKVTGINVEGLSKHEVATAEDCLSLLVLGESNRVVRQTKLNTSSSRSHVIFQLEFESLRPNSAGKLQQAKLSLCDLAGSERIYPEMKFAGKHFEELRNINLSLTTLGRVVSALAQRASKKLQHIPYRDSKLTRLLKDSIGGNTRTCLIATIAPVVDFADESINTLIFAERAKNVKVTVTVNEIGFSDNAVIRKLQQELQYLKDLLQLKRKGGSGDLHRQLLILKQENDRLRAAHNEWDQFENLKKENEVMRNELRKLQGIDDKLVRTQVREILTEHDTNQLVLPEIKTKTFVATPKKPLKENIRRNPLPLPTKQKTVPTKRCNSLNPKPRLMRENKHVVKLRNPVNKKEASVPPRVVRKTKTTHKV